MVQVDLEKRKAVRAAEMEANRAEQLSRLQVLPYTWRRIMAWCSISYRGVVYDIPDCVMP